MAFGFAGFCIRYNGSVSLSADLGHVSHHWVCETTEMLRTKSWALKIVMTVSSHTCQCICMNKIRSDKNLTHQSGSHVHHAEYDGWNIQCKNLKHVFQQFC